MRNENRLRLVIVLSVLLVCGIEAAAQATRQDWPRWRGANFDGTANTGKNIFSQPFSLRVRWRKSIGTGYSGVAVSEGHVITMASDGKKDYLISLSSDNGKENWRIPLAQAFPGKDGSTGGPVSTPAIDSGVAYGLGPYGELVAVRLRTGKELWRRQIARELGAEVPHWGFTTSPLVTGDLVIVMTGGTPDKAVTAFNKLTGATVWRSGSDAVNYASPVLARLGGRQVLIWGGDTILAALDPRDGKELWRYEHGGTGFYQRILNPILVRPGEYLITSKPDSSQLLRTSADAKPEPGWLTRELKLNYATPLVYGSYLFGYSGAFLTCVDSTTGALVWRSRAPGRGWPIIVDGHLVVVTQEEGLLTIGEATSEGWKEKASLQLFSRLVFTPPSFADGRIYARDSYSDIAAVDVVTDAQTPATVSVANRVAAATGTLPGSQFARWVSEVEGKPDAATRVKEYLAAQKSFPIIEGERFAHIIYEGDDAEVTVRGDMLEIGQTLPMRRIAGTNVQYASFEVMPGARIVYQFSKNFGQAFSDPKNPRQATASNINGPVSLLLMPGAEDSVPARATALRGRVVQLEIETPTARAETLTWGGKRKVWVYLPPGYDTDTARRYPTLYVLYGEQMLNEAHLDVLLDREVGNTLQPVISVFIESTNAYEQARTFREVHRRMLAEQLVPWIDGQFRTASEPSQRLLLGADEAGFGALETVLSYPKVFGNALAQSAYHLSSGDRELFELIDRAANKTQRFYLDWGRYDGRRVADQIDIAGFTKAVHDRMQGKGYRVKGREFNEGSSWLFMSQRIVPALREFLPLR
jgi:enterochelin esterase-like enzyme/outer membrane protein assembly factor BamB